MCAKKANLQPTASRTFQTIQDIYEFEEALINATLTADEKEALDKPVEGQLTFKTAQERDQHIKDLESEFQLENQFVIAKTGEAISPNDPEFNQLLKAGEVITAQEFINQTVVKPYQDGKQDKAILSLDPIIFKAKGKTAPSVPYLKVTVTTALETSHGASHLLHVKVRTKR